MSIGVTSGDLGSQETNPPLPVHWFGNVWETHEQPAFRDGVLSCCKITVDCKWCDGSKINICKRTR